MKKIVQYNIAVYYAVAAIVGLLIGLNRGFGIIIGIGEVIAGLVCFYYALQNNVTKVFTIFPYLIYSEIYVRAYVRIVPYLFLPYLIIAVFLVLFLKKGTLLKFHSRGFFLMVLFTIIEIADMFRSDDADTARFYVISTIELTVVILYASFNFLPAKVINTFFKHLKIASIYLAGIVLAAHLTGHIYYGTTSNSNSTNGLAPVQISGYLGFSCILFFFSVMDEAERKEIIINIILLSLTTILMILSFSRGGLYFLGIIMILYYFFNRTKKSSYFSFIILVPLAIFIYWYVSNITHGAIQERYAEPGASGRDVLIEIGFKLFNSNPLAGVGTGNFNTEILKEGLYDQESGAHNEFVRVAAEHGILGIITYWGFYIVLFFEILGRTKFKREYAIYFIVFFCLVIVHNGLKIAIQPFIMLLAVATPSLIKVKNKKQNSEVHFTKKLAV